MKESFFILSFCALLTSGCGSKPAQPTPALQTVPVPTVESDEGSPVATITSSGGFSSPTATLASPVAQTTMPDLPGMSADTFPDFAVVTQFFPSLQQAVAGLEGGYALDALAVSPDGRYLAIGGCTMGYRFSCPNSMDGTKSFIVIMNAGNGTVISTLPETDTTVTGLGFSSDSSQLLYTTYPQRLVVWDIAGQKVSATLFKNVEGSSKIWMRVSPTGSTAAVYSLSSLMIYELSTGQVVKELPSDGFAPHYSADGSHLAVFSKADASEITVYGTKSWQEIRRIQLEFESHAGNALDISADGRWIVTYPDSNQPAVGVWDVNTGEQTAVLDTPSGRVLSSEFSPNGDLLLISVSSDVEAVGVIGVWDVPSWKPIGELRSYSENGNLSFDLKTESMYASDGRDIWRWGSVDDQNRQSRQVVLAFFDALSGGDYAGAARRYHLDEYETQDLQSAGLDTSDPIGLLEAICAGGTRLCLPVLQVVPGGGLSPTGEYDVFVQFQAPDGSEYTSTYLSSFFYVLTGKNSDAEWTVNFIPYAE